MTPDTLIHVLQQGLLLALVVSAPAVLVAVLVGTIFSTLQAATQVHEPSLSSVPKILAVFAVIVLAGVWMLAQVVGFGAALLASFPQVR